MLRLLVDDDESVLREIGSLYLLVDKCSTVEFLNNGQVESRPSSFISRLFLVGTCY